ncbi:YwdI family protein [Bacillus sp. RO2]|uniref:YwdI family protein n=1 Tax=Bacillus sp. RO2 TaxID=2723913 RepID=UPI00145C4680|nr:YwdI family protein [Bacillus sp. RO2]NMH73791.1 YwdI family protein [Bacillus sp. RO2]
MSITLNKVLARLESELERAIDTGNVQKKREHLAAIKSLCELALETESEGDALTATRTASQPAAASTARSIQRAPISFEQAAPIYTPPTQPPTITNAPSKPIKEDDANGDSLFDF